jgi:RHS repeat-associated protein
MGFKMDTQFTVTAGGLITYEVQAAAIANANDGTYTLSFQGQTSNPIDWDATAAQVDTALEALTTIDTVTVSGSAGGPWTITFTGEHSGENVPQMTGSAANLENHQNRVLSFTYDAADQLTAASDPAAAYAYVYDNLGRVTSETIDPAGLTPNVVFAKTYDAAGNRLSVAATIGTTADFKNEYVYDGLNRMTQVIQQGQSGGNAVAAKRVDLTYNAAGQFDVISRFQSTGTTAPVATSHYGYDGMGRLTDFDHKTAGGATTLASYDYTFDAASRITSVNSLIDGLSTYTYDVTNQLTSADHATQPDETYSFDLNGNRTMTGYSVGDNNRLLSDGTYNYTYDNEGNRVTRTKISTGEQTIYDWDHRNRLTKVTEKNSGGTVLKTTENTYDVFDHWIRRSYDADGAGAGAATDTFFLYDDNQIVLEFDGAAAGDVSHRYLWGPDVDQFFSHEQVTSVASEGNVLWGLGDHLGTLRDIADRNETTGVTTVTNHRDYETFGTRLSETNSAVDLIFGFTSRLLDETTGLQDNWRRPYDPTVGQWISEDWITFEAGDANLRRYVNNSPLSFIDPSGLDNELPDKRDQKAARKLLAELMMEAEEEIKKDWDKIKAKYDPKDAAPYGKELSLRVQAKLEARNKKLLKSCKGTFKTGVLVDLETLEIVEIGVSRGTEEAMDVDVIYFEPGYNPKTGDVLDLDRIQAFELKASIDGKIGQKQKKKYEDTFNGKAIKVTSKYRNNANREVIDNVDFDMRMQRIGQAAELLGLAYTVYLVYNFDYEGEMLFELERKAENCRAANALGNPAIKFTARDELLIAYVNYIEAAFGGLADDEVATLRRGVRLRIIEKFGKGE